MVGVQTSGLRVTASACTVRDLIMRAFDLKEYQLPGTAKLLESSERYDIEARAPGGDPPSDEQARQMMRALLAERFQLITHRETKEMPVYALVIAKDRHKLTESSASGPLVRFGRSGKDVQLTFTGARVDSLVRQLPRMPGVDRPVLDRTGLTGKYDFQLTVSDVRLNLNPEPPSNPQSTDLEATSIFTALQEQLGLKLKPDKGQIEVLVVDRVEKPSEN